MPRKYTRKTDGPAYTKEDLARAVQDVDNKNMTYRQAQEYYNVPIAVISQRLNGRKTAIDSAGRGRKTALSPKTEKKIVECLLARANAGYPCDKDELLNLIEEYVKTHDLSTPFINGRPGTDWYHSFLKRHKDVLSLKKPEHLQKCRKDARTPDVIYSFYEQLRLTLSRLDIVDEEKACFIYNADESGFKSDPSRLRAIGEKGKPLSRVSGGSGRESTTVLACVAADGSFLPPLIVFKGAGIQARWISEKSYPGTLYSVSKNGWMEEPQFFTWFTKGFIPHIKRIRELKSLPHQAGALLYDGHASHISVRIVEEAILNNITLIKLPSHLTDMLQPLDKCVFGPVKTFWEKKLICFGKKQMGKGTGRLSKAEFVELLAEVWAQAIKPSNIISGFKSCGIFPVDKTKFPESAFRKQELEDYLHKQHPPRVACVTPQPIQQENVLITEVPPTDATADTDKTECSSSAQLNPQNCETSILQENNNLTCVHLPYETCTSSCVNLNAVEDTIPQENIPSDIAIQSSAATHETIPANLLEDTPQKPPLKTSLKRLFFKSPEKKENVTTIENTKSPTKKIVVCRLRQHAYGEVLTTEEVLSRLKEAQEKKSQKLKLGQKRKMPEVKELSKKNKNSHKEIKKKRIKSSSSEESEEVPVCISDGESPWEEEVDDEDQITITKTPISELKNGSFALVQFKGGKRNSIFYKYVCSIERVVDNDIEVAGLKSIDNTKENFALKPNDISFVTQDQIIGVLPFPEIKMKGERIYYHFIKKVPVLEDT